jgi:glycerol-3-phosphate dehydrogenase
MIETDIAIVGGGIAGLWLQTVISDAGYSSIVIEKDGLGAGQTLASQGMIHGGLKYSLQGTRSGASEAIADMPGVWRECLAGAKRPDLHQVKLLADRYFLFSDSALSGRLTAYLGAHAIMGGTRRLSPPDFPPPFDNNVFRGMLYELPDAVLDTVSLVTSLAEAQQGRLICGTPTIIRSARGIRELELDTTSVRAQCYILAAGQGNEALIREGQFEVAMQTRPLHQVMVKGRLPRLYAHGVSLKSLDKPRLTITSHPCDDGDIVWYLGGALAESGVHLSEPEQIVHAQSELDTMLPFIDLSGCQWATLRVDRAEHYQPHGRRPDEPYCERQDNVVFCWPTKLTLVPMLANRVLALIREQPEFDQPATDGLEPPRLARPPWSVAFK